MKIQGSSKSKSIKVSLFLFFCINIITLITSCSSTPQPKEPPKEIYQLTLYDNCPETTYARKAHMWLKLALPDYTGTISVQIENPPSKQDITQIEDYVLYCSIIAKAMSDGSGKNCTVQFNTRIDQSGTSLDFTTEDTALLALNTLTQEQEHEIYAFYIY